MDGVFANIPAKPQVQGQKDDQNEQQPPIYESALQDIAPPYFEMSITTPSVFGDEILVQGMPVGNFFQFLWNAAVAVTFQFIGVLLTYLLHNSHASRSGSMVGLGITFIHFGIQMRGGLGAMFGYDSPSTSIGEVTKPGTSYMDDSGYIVDVSSNNNPYYYNNAGSPSSSSSSAALANQDTNLEWLQADMEAHWVSLLLMITGWMIIVKSLAEYAYAKRTEKVIAALPADERDNIA
ncbi:hypothetical protein BG004_005657 [Podila humilis]|nr:hypothetical protein BG004_005657 [Podila humilis]